MRRRVLFLLFVFLGSIAAETAEGFVRFQRRRVCRTWARKYVTHVAQGCVLPRVLTCARRINGCGSANCGSTSSSCCRRTSCVQGAAQVKRVWNSQSGYGLSAWRYGLGIYGKAGLPDSTSSSATRLDGVAEFDSVARTIHVGLPTGTLVATNDSSFASLDVLAWTSLDESDTVATAENTWWSGGLTVSLGEALFRGGLSAAYWHRDTYNASNLNPQPGNHAMWSGTTFGGAGLPPNPGYGNDWDDLLEWRHQVQDPGVSSTVRLAFVFNHDLPDEADRFLVERVSAAGVETLATITGSSRDALGGFTTPVMFDETFVVAPDEYAGSQRDKIILRLRVVTDGSGSDEDGSVFSDGAVQVDDVIVEIDGLAVAVADFEPGGSDGGWTPVSSEPSMAGFAIQSDADSTWVTMTDVEFDFAFGAPFAGASFDFATLELVADAGYGDPVRLEGVVTSVAPLLDPVSPFSSRSFPNPFNPSLTIEFEAPGRGDVSVDVFDLSGRHVARVWSGLVERGRRQIEWRGLDENGRRVGSGVYIYRIEGFGGQEVRRITLLK